MSIDVIPLLPVVSTIIPVGPNYDPMWLQQAIQSTIEQEGEFSHEVVVWMDGATWPSFTERLPFTSVFGHAHNNMGVAHALNSAFALCRGDYIARLDADDYSLPGRYQAQLDFMRENALDVCGTAMQDASGLIPAPKGDAKGLILRGKVPVYHPTMFCTRQVMERIKYPESAQAMHAEDMWFHCAAVAHDYEYGNLDVPYVQYRLHASQACVVHREEQRKSAELAVAQFRRIVS